MSGNTLRSTWLGGALLVTFFGLALPQTAVAESHSGWRLRFYAASINLDNNVGGLGPGRGGGYDLDIGMGLGVNAEYRFSRRLGVDLGLLAGAGVDVGVRTVQIGGETWLTHDTVAFSPLTAGLDVHLTPDHRVDLYLCPLVAVVRYGGLVVRTGTGGVTTAVDIDDDFAVGAALGLAVPFGQRRWSFNASLTYLDSRLNGTGQGVRLDLDYDATIFGLGFGYRL